jgi:hypothetical protein
MLKDLLRIRDEIDCLIETYKDLHSNDDIHYDIYGNDVDQEEYETHDRGNNTHLDGLSEYNEKKTALIRVRENYYENKFSKSKGEKVTKPSKRSSSKCVYGDT